MNSAAQLRQQHSQIFRSRQKREEDLVTDLEREPLLDADGYEIPLWDHHGHRLQRRQRECDLDDAERHCGILLNLNTIDQMFNNVHEIIEPCYVNAEVYRSTDSVAKYPMAFLRSIGQIQARQPLPLLAQPLRTVNNTIARREEPSDDEHIQAAPHEFNENGDMIEPAHPPMHAVFGTSIQMYNRMLHFVAPRANEHEAVCGHLTAAKGGFFAQSSTDKERARRARNKIQFHLPHMRLQQAALSGHVSKDLRIEQVYVMDFDKVHPDHQNGRCVIIIILYNYYLSADAEYHHHFTGLFGIMFSLPWLIAGSMGIFCENWQSTLSSSSPCHFHMFFHGQPMAQPVPWRCLTRNSIRSPNSQKGTPASPIIWR